MFRNTGAVDLFFSSELDSIVTSKMDADSVWHENAVSQIFYSKDTTLIVPLAEIDSVAFGSRNGAELKSDVKVLTAADTLWVIRYDGECIYYRNDTPVSYLPSVGQKLFYGERKGIFPNGLVAQVTDVSFTANEYEVKISDVELSDIFSYLFYAGKVNAVNNVSQRKSRSEIDAGGNIHLEHKLSVENMDISVAGDVEISGTVVARPLSGYYSLDAKMGIDFNTEISVGEDDGEISIERNVVSIPLGSYALVFVPTLDLGVFCDFEGEMTANYRQNVETTYDVSYRRTKGADPVFEFKQGKQGLTNSAETNLLLCGELYLGVYGGIDFGLVGDIAGAKLRVKAGPSFSADFGVGALTNSANNYTPESYALAKLSACLKLGVEAEAYYRHLLGSLEEKNLMEMNLELAKKEINLFPNFYDCRAVKEVHTETVEVSTAEKTEEEIFSPVLCGVSIWEDKTLIDSVAIDTIKPNTEEVQGFEHTFDITDIAPEQTESKELTVRPFFYYADKVVMTQPYAVLSDMMIQPVVFAVSNGAVACTSGLPYTGEVVVDSTWYYAGNHVPIPTIDTVFTEKKEITVSSSITNDADIYGTWQGQEAGIDVTYTFNEDNTGMSVSQGITSSFTYSLNDPQSGRITLYFTEDEMVSKTLVVHSLSANQMQFSIYGKDEVYTFTKK